MAKSVFISSTSKDLPEHRAAADKAIRRLGMHPINMDDFGSQPGGASGVSVREVNKADIFVGIIAKRYGYVPEGMAKSVTEQEYDEAVRRKLPRLMYLLDPNYEWPEERIEADENAQTKLAAFRARIEKNEVRSLFRTAEDLAAQLTADLTKIGQQQQRQGRTTRWLIGLSALVAVVLLVGVGLLSALPQEQRSGILYSVGLVPASATPTATATATSTPTNTPTPTATFTPSSTPTSTPEFAKAKQGEILIIVAEFKNINAANMPTGETMAEQLNNVIEAASASAREDYDLQVRVARTAEIVTTKEQARAISFANQATIVIWGSVDSGGITTNYEIAQRWGQEVGIVIGETNFTALVNLDEVVIRFRRTIDQAYVANITIGQILINSEQYQAAVPLFEAAIDLIKDEPTEVLRELDAGKIYTLLGALYGLDALQSGQSEAVNFEPGIAAMNRAIEIDPTDENVNVIYQGLASFYSLQREFDPALVNLEKAIEFEPNNAQLYVNRGNIYVMQENFPDALKDFERAIELQPDLAESYAGRANIYTTVERYEEALADYDKVLSLEPDNAPARMGRGLVFAGQGDYEAALLEFDQAVENCLVINVGCEIIYTERGKAYSNLDQYDAAIQDFEQAIELDPAYNPALYRLGLTYSILGQYEDAISYLDRSIETCVDNCYADYLLRAAASSSIGDDTQAIADYSKAVELNPDNYFAYYSRGFIYINNEAYALAIEDFTNSIALCTEGCDFDYFLRGLAYYALDDFENALVDTNQVIALSPDFPSAYLVRGGIYFAFNDTRASAQDLWRWLQMTQTELVEGEPLDSRESMFETTLDMKVGSVYQITFEGQAGESVNVTATGVEEALVDPLIGILNDNGEPLIFNDDIVPEENQNSQIEGYVLPADGAYTVVVGQAGSGGDGAIRVTILIDRTETVEATAEATP